MAAGVHKVLQLPLECNVKEYKVGEAIIEILQLKEEEEK